MVLNNAYAKHKSKTTRTNAATACKPCRWSGPMTPMCLRYFTNWQDSRPMLVRGWNRRVRFGPPSCSRHIAREGGQAADRDPTGRSAYVELYPWRRGGCSDRRYPDDHGGAPARIPGEAWSDRSPAADHSGGCVRSAAGAAMPPRSGRDRFGPDRSGNPFQPATILVGRPLGRRGPRTTGGRVVLRARRGAARGPRRLPSS